jgi:hypothetical protein
LFERRLFEERIAKIACRECDADTAGQQRQYSDPRRRSDETAAFDDSVLSGGLAFSFW